MADSGLRSRDHVIGTSMRMMGKRELAELIASNPGTFYIPEEYAMVTKPLACRSACNPASVPDLPPKRTESRSKTPLTRTPAGNNPPTKSIGVADDKDTPANKSTTKRVGFADDKGTPATGKPTKKVGFAEDKVTLAGENPTTKRAGIADDATAPPSPPSKDVPAVPPRPPSCPRRGSGTDGTYAHISESMAGSCKPQKCVPPDLKRTQSDFSLDPNRPPRQTGHASQSQRSVYRTTSIDYVSPSAQSEVQFDFGDNNDGVLLSRQSSRKPSIPECVDVEVFLTEHENMLRGVLELSTLHHDVIDKVKLRVVCLFDISGSMMLKCGRSRKHSKLNKLKKMAADLVDVLEDGDDYVGLVAFGEGTRVVCPLTKVDSRSRVNLKEAIATVDKEIDSKTDLVNGVLRAIDLLKTGQQVYDKSYRNAIIVFSDGEINSGEMDPDKVVHAIRQRIRDTNPHPVRAEGEFQWLSLACVTTGGNVSDAMYLVSKCCGNDAYYYVDSDLDNPEVDMLIPLLLRKAAVAQFITLGINSSNGATLITEKCTREHSIRRRREEKKTANMTYFLHDLPAGSQKHFSIAVDLANYSRESDSDVVVINVEYVDANGDTRTVKRTVRFSEALTPLKDPERYDKGVLLSAKADMRSVFQNACRDAADLVQKGPDSNPSEALNDGKSKLQHLMEHYGSMAKREETKTKIKEFSWALVENLDKLITSMEKSVRGAGHKWTKIKAVSSAVVRETPNVSKLVAKSETICPLPVFKNCATTRMTALALKLYRKQEVTSVVFPNQNLFDAAKVVMQSLGNIVDVLNQVESVPPESATLRRNIISTMIIDQDELSDD